MNLFALLLLVMLTGCAATIERNYQPTREDIVSPPLNEVREAGIGDDVVRRRVSAIYDAVFVPENLVMGQGSYTIRPGLYRKIGQNDDGEFFSPWGGAEGGQVVKISLVDDAEALVLRSNGKLCVLSVTELFACGQAGGFERVKRAEPGGSDEALFYNGRIDKRIRLGHRSLSRDRPSTSNNIEYDLEESNVIAYRGAQIEVLEATSRSIRYRVLRIFDNR